MTRGAQYCKMAAATVPAGWFRMFEKWSFDRRLCVGSVQLGSVHGSNWWRPLASTTVVEPVFSPWVAAAISGVI